MISQNFDVLAAILALIGSLNYAWVTFKGKAQPNRVSWLLWTITPSITFAAEIVQHVHIEVALLTLSEAVGPLFVMIASLMNRQAFWKISRFDVYCGIVAALALVLWIVSGQGNIAIAFSLLASLFSAIPTIIKAYSFPASESPGDYVASLIAGIITLLTIKEWNLGNYGFPVYITLESAIISFLILTPKRIKSVVPANGQAAPAVTSTAAPAAPAVSVLPDGATPDNIVLPTAGPATTPAQALPVLGQPKWTSNPAKHDTITELNVPITTYGVDVVEGECIEGMRPGSGKTAPMAILNGQLAAAVNTNVAPGLYPFSIRAKDAAGNWSKVVTTTLTILPPLPAASPTASTSPLSNTAQATNTPPSPTGTM